MNQQSDISIRTEFFKKIRFTIPAAGIPAGIAIREATSDSSKGRLPEKRSNSLRNFQYCDVFKFN